MSQINQSMNENREKFDQDNVLEMDEESNIIFLKTYRIAFKKTLNDLSKQSIKNIKILAMLFLIGLFTMVYIVHSFPKLDDLQTFAIPGPLILSIISGALFGKVYGFLLVCFVASIGASGCYYVSYSFARYFVFKFFSNRIVQFKHSLEQNKNNLFFYLLFIRITPILPNWLINLSSPVVGVPYKHFLLATFFGLMPANILHVNMGSELATIKKIGFDFKIIVFLLLLGVVALIPVWAKKLFSKYFNTEILNKKTK